MDFQVRVSGEKPRIFRTFEAAQADCLDEIEAGTPVEIVTVNTGPRYPNKVWWYDHTTGVWVERTPTPSNP